MFRQIRADDSRQPPLEAVDLLRVGSLEPEPCLLHGIVGLVQRAEDPVGDRPQLRALAIERVSLLNFAHAVTPSWSRGHTK
jgi:hypothetical protein